MSKFSSIFSQLLSLFSKSDFYYAVHDTNAERHSRGFGCWDQFVAMLFCQLGRAHSLREICGGLQTCFGKLRHLGLEKAPSHSTLSYANEHRPYELYERVFFQFLARCRSEALLKGHKFRFKNKLMSLDATVIDLCLSMYDWAKFRRTKGAIKLHLLLDHDGYLPSFALITEGKTHEVTIAKQLHYAPGTILVFDKGYNDYTFFGRLCNDGVFFVTRIKSNAVYEVIEERPVPHNRQVLSDNIIRLTGVDAQNKCPYLLRRVEVWDPEEEKILVFLTNNLKLGATTIAAIYKDRWQIETFFKALKQNLKIKTFVGTTANAVKIQIWTALIAMLVVKYLKLRSTFGWSLSNLIALLRMNLFNYRDLWRWLDTPFEIPIVEPSAVQLEIKWR
jgi:hypothetical protein